MPYIKIEELSALKRISVLATMKTADFDSYNNEINILIKGKTKLWRETWIISPLNEIIGNIEGRNK